jgi:hypothetical protein
VVDLNKKLLPFFLVVLFVISTGFAVDVDFTGFYEAEPSLFSFFTKPLVIVGARDAYYVGETISFGASIGVSANCDTLLAELTIKSTLLGMPVKILYTTKKNFGKAGYVTAFWTVNIYNNDLSPGSYVLEVQWICKINNVEYILGSDGVIDSNKEPDRFYFKIISSGEERKPPPTCKINSCSVGQKLMNPDSPNCYCKDMWKPDNGKCEVGEPLYTPDCQKKCPEGQVLKGGICVNEDDLFPNNGGGGNGGGGNGGGNNDTNNGQGGLPLNEQEKLILGGVIALIGLLLMSNKGGRK